MVPENCLFVNGCKHDLSAAEAEALLAHLRHLPVRPLPARPDCATNKKVPLRNLNPGDVFAIENGDKFIVLNHHYGAGTMVLKLTSLRDKTRFGDNNHLIGSVVGTFLQEYKNNILAPILGDNLLDHTVDLVGDTGHGGYAPVFCGISILTKDQFWEYREVIRGHRLGSDWWLATPCSGRQDFVETVLDDSLKTSFANASIGELSIRPVIVLKPSFEVLVEDPAR